MVQSAVKLEMDAFLVNQQKIPFWILEDDDGCNFIYEEIFQHKYNYRIFKTLSSFREAYFSENYEKPKLMLADLRLPDGSFVSFLNEIPSYDLENLAIMIVSVCDDLDIIRYCLGEGVLDYLTKPFNRSELLVKIERSVNRIQKQHKSLLIDPLRRRVTTKNNLHAELTSKELMIFDMINNSPNRQIRRIDLVQRVWKDVSVGSKTLDVHIFNIRRKLSKLDVHIKYIPPQTYSIHYD